MKLFRTFLTITLFYLACAAAVAVACNPSMFAAAGVTSAGLLFTAAGGVGVPFSFNLTYLPEFLMFNHAGNQLTSLRVETQEDGVLHDWLAAGINAMNGFMKVGAMTANDVTLRLSDGELRPKNVTISGVTSAVGAINFFGYSDNKGTAAFKSSNAAILALNPTAFEKFTALFIPTMATSTDYAEITYDDGHSQRWEIEELRSSSSQYQQVEGIIINNFNGYIRRAVVRCAAATPAYILSVKTV
jgi:hypothetical protein